MDFLEILFDIPTWRQASKTYVVHVTQPEDFMGYMIEIDTSSPRHLSDLLCKFQPLLVWTRENVFCTVLLAFQYDQKYYVIYEYFQEVMIEITLEQARDFYMQTKFILEKMHRKGYFHGDICADNIKTTEQGLKIVGWRIPAARSFDPEPEVDWKLKDIEDLKKAVSEISGLDQSLLEAEVNEPGSLPEPEPNGDSKTYTNGIFFISSNELKFYSYEFDQTSAICDCRIPKGSTLSCYNGILLNAGGDFNTTSFKKFDFNTQTWESLPELLTPHKYHTTTTYGAEYWVLAGINSFKCEKFNGVRWETCPDLEDVHDSPTCSIYKTLYLCSKTIEKLEQTSWVKIVYIETIGSLGVFKTPTEFIILGGRTMSKYNADVYTVGLETKSITKLKEGVNGMYGLFGYTIVSGVLYAASNGGKILIETLTD